MNALRIFLSGTDTGIGKTWISARLLAMAPGPRKAYLKPVQTGVDGGDDDAAWVASRVPGVEARAILRFGKPLAPLFAARAEGAVLDAASLIDRCRKAIPEAGDLVIEGAGGLLVPITEEWTMADLARALELPLVLVARAGLGTLNHTLLSLEAASNRKLPVAAVILNPGPDPVDLSLARENRDYLAAKTVAPVFLWEEAMAAAFLRSILMGR